MRFVVLTGMIALMTSAAIAGSPETATMDPDVISVAAVESGNDNWVGVLMTFVTIVWVGIGG